MTAEQTAPEAVERLRRRIVHEHEHGLPSVAMGDEVLSVFAELDRVREEVGQLRGALAGIADALDLPHAADVDGEQKRDYLLNSRVTLVRQSVRDMLREPTARGIAGEIGLLAELVSHFPAAYRPAALPAPEPPSVAPVSPALVADVLRRAANVFEDDSVSDGDLPGAIALAAISVARSATETSADGGVLSAAELYSRARDALAGHLALDEASDLALAQWARSLAGPKVVTKVTEAAAAAERLGAVAEQQAGGGAG